MWALAVVKGHYLGQDLLPPSIAPAPQQHHAMHAHPCAKALSMACMHMGDMMGCAASACSMMVRTSLLPAVG